MQRQSTLKDTGRKPAIKKSPSSYQAAQSSLLQLNASPIDTVLFIEVINLVVTLHLEGFLLGKGSARIMP